MIRREGGESTLADCIFCKIAGHDIPSTVVYEDDEVIAFRDLNPQAPTHVLIIPKKHIDSVNAFDVSDKDVIAHIFVDVAPKLAKQLGIDESGFRLVINTGKEGGQTVDHLHVHLLGGREMKWPPG